MDSDNNKMVYHIFPADVPFHDTLTNTMWLTSGPKVQALETEIEQFIGGGNALCVNSCFNRKDKTI